MTDRRSHRRFALGKCAGEIRLLHDVVLESSTAQTVSVIGRAASVAGEELLLHVVGRHGWATALTVRTLESVPVLVDEGLRHRLRLRIVRVGTSAGPVGAPQWSDDDSVGCVLIRRSAVRLLDVSARGCLLESAVGLSVGAAALLDITMDGRQYVEMIRVCRTVEPAPASGSGRAGAEFLPTFEAASRSIRPLVASLEIHDAGLPRPRRDFADDAEVPRKARVLFWPQAEEFPE